MKQIYLFLFLLTSSSGFAQLTIGHHSTSSVACDGYVYADSTFTEASLQWVDENSIVIGSGYFLNDLCPGNYGLTGLPPELEIDTIWFDIVDLSTYDAEMYAGDIHHDYTNNCTGYIIIGANRDLTPPFTIEYLLGEEAGAGYCSDYYSVNVTDATGISGQFDFVILGGDNIYEAPIDSLPGDSLIGGVLENCDINYSSIDSVQLSALVSADSNVIIHWTVFQADGSITDVYDTLSYNGLSGTYYVEMTYYCPNKSTYQFAGFRGTVNLPAIMELSLSEFSDDHLTIYPNPFTDMLTIKLEKSATYTAGIYDAAGRLIISETFTGDQHTIATENINASGLYIVRINDGISTVNRRIVK